MEIGIKNLKLKFYDHKNHWHLEIKEKLLAYNLEIGQEIYRIRYSDSAANYYLKHYVKILEIDEKGIKFKNWHGEEFFYTWERDYTNIFGEIERVHIVIEPCETLYEEPADIEKLICGEIQHEEGIWYKHGGWRTGSKYEKNLKNFILTGQQKMF